jgi:AcrR family transcriptional regulator
MVGDVKPHRGLTTERVVDAALRAAGQGGLEGVSLRRLARALDVTPMAIYRRESGLFRGRGIRLTSFCVRL